MLNFFSGNEEAALKTALRDMLSRRSWSLALQSNEQAGKEDSVCVLGAKALPSPDSSGTGMGAFETDL